MSDTSNKILPLHETALHFGAKDSDVKAWVRQGCPCFTLNHVAPTARGAVLRFDVTAVQRWHESFTKPANILEQFSFDFK